MTSQAKPLNVLFLCTHNSARSILAGALLNAMGNGRFKAYSAGSSPRDNQRPNPLGLQVLQGAGISIEGLHSKSWGCLCHTRCPRDGPDHHRVCDNAAGEVCPIWPGHPATARWSCPIRRKATVATRRKLEAFRKTLLAIKRRLERLQPAQREAGCDIAAIQRTPIGKYLSTPTMSLINVK